MLRRVAANPPTKRCEYRTDIPGCYLRVGPCSLSLSVIRRDGADKQIRLTIPLDPLDLPDLPTLKRAIRVAKDQCCPNECGGTPAHSLMAVGVRVIESKRLTMSTEKNYLREPVRLFQCAFVEGAPWPARPLAISAAGHTDLLAIERRYYLK